MFGGLVVIVSSIFAVKTALRNFNAHQRWAIRLYLAANGVLFFRLLIFAWFLAFGTLGVDTATFTGPAVLVLAFALT